MTRKTWDQDVDNVYNHPWARLFTKPPQNQLDCHIRDRGNAVLSNAVCSSNEALDGTQSMKNPLIIGLIVYALLLAGAFAGWKMRNRLPAHHLTDETKGLVNMSTAVVATVSALVLGLLISNANTTFTRLGGEVTSLSAEILRLDQILRRYGSAADPARGTLRQYAEKKTADLFPEDAAHVDLVDSATYELLQRLEDACPQTCKPTRPMVAGAGYDTRRKDR